MVRELSELATEYNTAVGNTLDGSTVPYMGPDGPQILFSEASELHVLTVRSAPSGWGARRGGELGVAAAHPPPHHPTAPPPPCCCN